MDKTQIEIVIGVAYGDEGKGRTVADIIQHKLDNSITPEHLLNVRFNGGSQASHTVVYEQSRHAFSHYGAGTFQGVQTFLTSNFIINPIMLRRETDCLIKTIANNPKFVSSKLNIKPVLCARSAKISTPYDMLANQIIEKYRSKNGTQHGSCGLGINETIYRYKMFVYNDMYHYAILSSIENLMHHQRDRFEYYDDQFAYVKRQCKDIFMFGEVEKSHIYAFFINRICKEIYVDKDELIKEIPLLLGITDQSFNEFMNNCIDQWFKDLCSLNLRFVNDDYIQQSIYKQQYNTIVFEGAQGLWLDQRYGKFPHVTNSNTGLTNMCELLSVVSHLIDINVNWVTRCYTTRHGAGPLDYERSFDEMAQLGYNIVDETNVPNPFQGSLRYGLMNLDSIRSAIGLDRFWFVGKFPRGHFGVDFDVIKEQRLIVTCVDQFDVKKTGKFIYVDIDDKVRQYVCDDFGVFAKTHLSQLFDGQTALIITNSPETK